MNFAFQTYQNVEAPENYKDLASLEKYRALLMQRAAEKEFPFFDSCITAPSRVLEIGSGNSRLLYGLDQRGALIAGTGVEISPSRHAFAEAWKKDLGNTNVTNICGDFLEIDLPQEPYDVVLCLTSIFPFFDMLQPNGFSLFLKKCAAVLKPGGQLILETFCFQDERKMCALSGGRARVWDEFAQDDPFRFNLVTYDWNNQTHALTAETYNIMRDRFGIDGPTYKKWHLAPAEEIVTALTSHGFTVTKQYGDYQRSPLTDASPFLILIAEKTV